MSTVGQYNAGEVIRAGERFGLKVDDDGNWLATVAGRDLSKPTRDLLIKDIDRILRLEKKAVHIPFTYMEGKSSGYLKLRHGVVTGKHSVTGNLLVSWDDGTNGQMAVGSHTEVLKRLTVAEEDELKMLTRQAYEMGEALRSYVSRKVVYKGSKGLVDQVDELLAKEGK